MRVERPHGITLPVAVFGHGDKRMVFAHSLIGNGTGAGPLFEPIIKQGWTVAAYDQRSHGGATPLTDPARLALDELADDYLAVLDALSWDTAWFGGGSMGAGVAQAAALKQPERVEGLLLMAPAFGLERNAGADAFAEVGQVFATQGFEAGRAEWLAQFGADNVAQLDGLSAEVLACLLTTVPGWTLPSLDLPDVPTIVLAWKGDDVHPWWLADQLARGQAHEVGVADLFGAAAKLLEDGLSL